MGFETIYTFLKNLQPIAVLATAIAVSLAVKIIFSMRRNDLVHLDQAFKSIDTKIESHHTVVKENFAAVHKSIGEVHRRMDDHLRDHASGSLKG